MTPDNLHEPNRRREESKVDFDLSELFDCVDLVGWLGRMIRGLVRAMVDLAGAVMDVLSPLFEVLGSLGEGLLSALDFLSFF